MDLSGIVRILFRDKEKYKHISEEEKESVFFIINRRISKYALLNAESLNKKGIDMALALDIWYEYCSKTTDIPYTFWNGLKNLSKSKDILTGLSDKDKYIITNFFTQDYNEYIEEQNKKEESIQKTIIKQKKSKQKK